jgi:hypothetical protein
MGPERRFGVTQQSHHLAYDIQLWWRLGGSGLEFAITRQRRIKKFSQRIGTAVRAVPQGSSKCLPNLFIRARMQGRESVAGGQSATIL